MVRLMLSLLGLYGLLSIATKLAERAGIVGCPCPDECRCQRPAFAAVRYIAPVDHVPL